MSDQSQGPGWWQASDGKWYAPELHPDYRPAVPPPPQVPTSPQPPAGQPLGGWTPAQGPIGQISSDPPPSRPWYRTRVFPIVSGIVLLLVLIGAIASGGDDKKMLTGEFALTDSSETIAEGTSSCHGDGGYSDFGIGMDVTVRNGNGDIIATTDTETLDEYADATGEDPDEMRTGVVLAYGPEWCVVFWHAKVPSDEAFYEVETGRRGSLHYSRSEMRDKDWHVAASLGD
jgi:hypothetical protein